MESCIIHSVDAFSARLLKFEGRPISIECSATLAAVCMCVCVKEMDGCNEAGVPDDWVEEWNWFYWWGERGLGMCN